MDSVSLSKFEQITFQDVGNLRLEFEACMALDASPVDKALKCRSLSKQLKVVLLDSRSGEARMMNESLYCEVLSYLRLINHGNSKPLLSSGRHV